MLKIPYDTLVDLYLNQNKTQREIADIYGCSAGYVTLILRRSGISKNKANYSRKKKPSKKILEKLYEEKSLEELCKLLDVSKSLLYTWLSEYKIKRKIRDYDEFPSLTEIQNQIIIGSLLGDAWIDYIGGGTVCRFLKVQARPKRKPDREEYLQWHFDVFGDYSLSLKEFKNKVSIFPQNKESNKISSSDGYIFKTHSHLIFDELEKMWYLRDEFGNHILNDLGRRIKIVPKELKLTPLVAAIWFCDDGSNCVNGRRASFHANGFTDDEREFLVYRLKEDLGINARRYRDVILVSNQSYFDLIDMIKEYVIWDCFKYKIETKPVVPQFGETAHSAKLTEKQVRKVFYFYKKGKTCKQIAKKYSVEEGTISSILRGKNWKHLGLASKSNLSLRNTSGETGIYKKEDKWEVKFMKKGRTFRGGVFEKFDEALKVKNEIITYTWEEYRKSIFHNKKEKIDLKDIDVIFKLKESGFKNKEIALKMNVAPSCISLILNGKRRTKIGKSEV